MGEQIYENQRSLASNSVFDIKNIVWTPKQSLKITAESLMKDEIVKKMPLEYRARLRSKLDDLLRRKEVDEKKLKEEGEMLRANLAKEISEKSLKKWKNIDLLWKARNIFSKAWTKAEILTDEKIFQEKSILDYDSKRWNYKKSVKEFEKELNEKNIEQINIRWLASYLEYLKETRWSINSFAKKIKSDQKFTCTLLFTSTISTNTKSLLKKQLIEDGNTELISELNTLMLTELKKDTRYKTFFEQIFNKEKWYLKWINEHELTMFAIKMQNCDSIEGLMENLRSLKIDERNIVEIKWIFGYAYKDVIEHKKELDRSKRIHENNWWIKITEKHTLIQIFWQHFAGLIPDYLRKKKIKQLEKKDWHELDKIWVTSQLPTGVQKSINIVKLEAQNIVEEKRLSELSKSNNSACNVQNACKISNDEDRKKAFQDLFRLDEKNFAYKQKIIDKIQIIKIIPWFGWVQNEENINQLLDDEIKFKPLIDYLTNKKNKTQEEEEILSWSIEYTKNQERSKVHVDRALKKDTNKKIENQIQDEFLFVIQSIPWYKNVTHIWDIMYDKYALDWAISYLSKIRNKTKKQNDVLDKLKQFRENLWEINKWEKTVSKNDSQMLSIENRNIPSLISQQYIANNNNFDLSYILSWNRDSRKSFFDIFFYYIDNNWDSVKYLKTPTWTKFAISKDGESTYKIKYWDREIKSLTREQTRESVSFALFLEPLGLSELIPYSTRIINEINKKSNWEPINDRDWMNEKEKNLCLSKLWQAIIPNFEKKPELEQNKEQFTNLEIINNNLKAEKKTQDYWKITSLSQLLKIQFPTSSKDSFDIKALLEAIPS